VIVSDIGLPGEDGYALIRRIRLSHPNPCGRIPAIALTAYARPEDRTRALAAGYQVYLVKPVEPVTLVNHIAALAAGPPAEIATPLTNPATEAPTTATSIS
jgi:CheY-like chemotaxis protein